MGLEAWRNGFLTGEDPARLPKIGYPFEAEKLKALFDPGVEPIPWRWSAEPRTAGYPHPFRIGQREVSRTQGFRDPEPGGAWIENWIRDHLDRGCPDRVSLILERQVTKATPGECPTRVWREGVPPTLRIPYQQSALKPDLQEGRALRTERRFHHTQDVGRTRGLKNFTPRLDLGCQSNHRLLEQEILSPDFFLPLPTIQAWGPSPTENGPRASALRWADRRVMAWLDAWAGPSYIPRPIGNHAWPPLLAQRWDTSYSRAPRT